MSIAEQYGGGAKVLVKTALTPNTIQPSSAGAAPTTQDGITIDRTALTRRYYSCRASIVGAFTAGSSMQVQSLSVLIRHSSDGTSWDNLTTAASATFGTSSTNGSTGTTGGAAYQEVSSLANLNGARRYLSIQIPSPTFADCSSGRSLAVAGVIAFTGADELPAL